LKKKIVFICTGNTCRSPMAEAILRKALKEHGLADQYEAASAGLSVAYESGANPKSLQVCRDNGIDLSEHRARQADEAMLWDAYMILTMTQAHRQEILFHFPETDKRVSTLRAYSFSLKPEEYSDISDPYGGDLALYAKIFIEIKDCINRMMQKLIHTDIQEEI